MTRRSMHRDYRGFWIRYTKQNRLTVDQFLLRWQGPNPMLPARTDPEVQWTYQTLDKFIDSINECEDEYVRHVRHVQVYRRIRDDILDVCYECDGIAVGSEDRAECIRKALRLVVQAYPAIKACHVWDSFQHNALKNKLLYLCQKGLSEAYLTFSLFFPEMCTREIQPTFNFKTIYYSDDHLDELRIDPVFGPLAKNMRYMSGYNKQWRQC